MTTSIYFRQNTSLKFDTRKFKPASSSIVFQESDSGQYYALEWKFTRADLDEMMKKMEPAAIPLCPVA
jgi:hypothetical protein